MRISVCVALATAALLAVGRVHAQSAQDLETARDLFKQATELHDAHDVKGALAKFKAAHELANTPVTGIELARTYAELGMLTEAREVALAIDKIAVKPNESEKTKRARTDAVALADAVYPRIASLTIVLDNVLAGSTVSVSVDGETLPSAAVGAPRKVNPGAHSVVASAGGPSTTSNVSLGEGESRTVHITLELPAAPPPPPPPEPVVTAPPPVSNPVTASEPVPFAPVVRDAPATGLSPDLYKWAGISVGVGAGSVALGALFGAIVLDMQSTVSTHCNAFKQCDSTGLSAAKDAHGLATASTAFIAIGSGLVGVGIVLAVIGFATSGSSSVKSAPPEKALLIVTPTAGGISIGSAGTF